MLDMGHPTLKVKDIVQSQRSTCLFEVHFELLNFVVYHPITKELRRVTTKGPHTLKCQLARGMCKTQNILSYEGLWALIKHLSYINAYI